MSSIWKFRTCHLLDENVKCTVFFTLILLFHISFLSQRKSEGEHESSRRLKTQFLIEMEGFDSGSEQILLIGNCKDWVQIPLFHFSHCFCSIPILAKYPSRV